MREKVQERLAAGESMSEIAFALGVSTNTVRYHRERLRVEETAASDVPVAAVAAADVSAARSSVGTREAVATLLAEGLSRAETARRLGVTKSTVSYHARRLGAVVDERCSRRYDWAAVQAFYDAGNSLAKCIEAFGFASQSWNDAVRRGAIVPRPIGSPLEELCVAGVPRSRENLKRRLLRAGAKDGRCENCGLDGWRGAPLSLALHHVNGDGLDNRLENLQLLCPNCHSQTPTYGARNRRAA